MDQGLRNKLRNVVTQCRKLLEESVSQELQGKFGIYAANKNSVQVDDDARMIHLSDEDRRYRRDLLDHLDHIQSSIHPGTTKDKRQRTKDTLDQLVREIAFTHLNRLCAYKMMETREVYVGGQKFREAVSRGVNSNGVKFYLADHPEDERLFNTGQQDIAYRHFLDWLGGMLSEEIGVLFNPSDSANRLYPPQRVLDVVLSLINDDELADIWAQDETIGWVYQYFTPKELRDQARKESQAPRNSYELAFRNQFFTPRYVVEFLTDNTLGRIWYEMRQGDTKLAKEADPARCRYMVRRPTEIFDPPENSVDTKPQMNTDEHGCSTKEASDPSSSEICVHPCSSVADSSSLSQEELLKQPVHIPHRAKKDPRELKVLDPACGSGHFLLYCFDVLLTIYEEAYADPDLGLALKKDYPTLDALKRDVPRLILAHNLHGIDIDLRATQIAALALWLRCQRAYRELGLKQDRPKITRSNIVCAEPMPGEDHLLEGFLKTLREDKLEALIRRVMQIPADKWIRATEAMADRLCELIRLVWEKMRLAGEAGGLLKIEAELQEAIREGQEVFEEKTPLFRITEYSLNQEPTERYYRFVTGDVEDERVSFWDMAERLVLAALRDYTRHAVNGRRLQRQLFTDDAERGFAFIDICQKRFDVVLMNPPFGSPSVLSRPLLTAQYKDCKDDIDAAFVRRGTTLLRDSGRLGVIANRTEFFKPALREWRQDLILSSCPVVQAADLGYGVLDTALVEAAAYVLSRRTCTAESLACFFRLLKDQDKGAALHRLIGVANKERFPDEGVFVQRLSTFWTLPESRVAYWAASSLVSAFTRLPSLVSSAGVPQFGVSTKDDFRFLRLAWEVSFAGITTSREKCRSASWMDGDYAWVPFAKGGEYAPYFGDIHLLIDWTGEGKRLSEFLSAKYPYLNGKTDWILHPESDYFKGGLTYTRRTTSSFSPRFLPAGCVFSEKGLSIFSTPEEAAGELLAILMSRVTAFFIEMMVEAGDAVSSGSAARTYELNVVSSLPIPRIIDSDARDLRSLAVSIWKKLCGLDSRRETSRYFAFPFRGIGVGAADSLTSLATRLDGETDDIFVRVLEDSWTVEKKARQLFGLDASALMQVDREIGVHPCSLSERRCLAGEDGFRSTLEANTEEIIDDEVEESGGSRAITKKCYYVDRHIELLCHVFQAHPKSVVSAKRSLQLLSRDSVLRFSKDVISYLVGVVVGRWDVQKAGESAIGALNVRSPFAPLPACSPGMLQGDDGLPLTATPEGYPLRIDWDGILVDDADHPDDVVRRVRDVLEVIWPDRAEAIEQEACQMLGVRELRDYFRKPGKGGFWDDHVSRYSKSRRKAPIYWLLQSSKKNYALWLYYHRLDQDLLFKALVNYVEPKIRLVESQLSLVSGQLSLVSGHLQSTKDEGQMTNDQRPMTKDRKRLAKEVEHQEDLLSELRDFEEKLRRAANLHLQPDLNDGVVLNIAPLHELVPWKEAKKYWQELLDGKYEWSSIGKQLRAKGMVK